MVFRYISTIQAPKFAFWRVIVELQSQQFTRKLHKYWLVGVRTPKVRTKSSTLWTYPQSYPHGTIACMELYERGKSVLPILADAITRLEGRIAQMKADGASRKDIAEVEKQLREAKKCYARLPKTLERLKNASKEYHPNQDSRANF